MPQALSTDATPLRIVPVAPGDGLPAALIDEFRQRIGSSPPGRTVWLAPNRRLAAEAAARLLGDQPVLLNPQTLTWDQFAGRLLRFASVPLAPLTQGMKRHLVGRLIRAARSRGELTYFEPLAGTPGLVDLVSEFITRMKSSERWPEELRDQLDTLPGPISRNAELVELYAAYQKTLLAHHYYDREGLYWTAREALRGGQIRPFEAVRRVYVVGFTALSASQHEMLGLLARRVEHTTLTLPLADEPERPEITQSTVATWRRIDRTYPKVELADPLPTTGRRPAGLEHLAAELFKNPRRQTPSAQTAGVEILAAAGTRRELELVGRRIKRLLREGHTPPSTDGRRPGPANRMPVTPGEVLVVARELGAVSPLVEEVFTELGLPFVLDSGPGLASLPGMSRIVGLLELAHKGWEFRLLVSLLGSNYFQPAWPQAADRAAEAATGIVHQLGIMRGQELMLARVERIAAIDLATQPPSRRIQQRVLAARQALPLLKRLAKTLADLPQRATLAVWIERLTSLLDETGWLQVAAQPRAGHPNGPALDWLGWQRLLASLRATVELENRLDRRPPELNRKEFAATISEVIHGERLGQLEPEAGRVRVLAAHRAVGMRVPYVFVMGMNEGSFPPSSRVELGPIDTSSRADASEMALFYQLTCQAQRLLVLSYPALDERAQPVLPSPFLTEVQGAFGVDDQGQPHLPEQRLLDLTPTAALDRPATDSQPVCPRQWRIAALARATREQPDAAKWLAGWLRHGGPATAIAGLRAAVELHRSRAERLEFGPFEGILPTEAARQWLTQMAEKRVWSPSQLEGYTLCPFRFLVEKVLRIEPLDELALDTDRLRSGEAFHNALERMHRRLNQAQGGPASPVPLDADEVRQAFMEALDAEFAALAEPDDSLHSGLLEIERRQLVELGVRYLTQHADYDKQVADLTQPLRPAHFEVGFGGSLSEDDDPLSTTEPLVLVDDESGQAIRISGRIDRLDLGGTEQGPVFAIIDYKTGGSTRYNVKKLASGESNTLQLPLYALAARDLLLADRGALPWGVGYWLVKGKGLDALKCLDIEGPHVQPNATWQRIEDDVRRRVFDIVGDLTSGKFPVASSDDHCTSYCEFARTCRVNQIRSLKKPWPPAATPPS